MLFNSYEFIFLYLPVVLAGFFWIARRSHRLAALWLGSASLFFYGFSNPRLVFLLLASITFNYAMGYAIGHERLRSRATQLLAAAVAANLGLLGYFKYANFFIATAGTLTGHEFGLLDVVLPIGISFFTFTQIAFLVDVYRGIAREYSFIHYILFVTYFPHLIAGPVLHHKEMMPQFASASTYRITARNLGIGITVFTIGLAKKVLLADTFAEYADPLFDATPLDTPPDLVSAWLGVLAYTLQLYFDFSGYSDMAIGISLLFGIELPLNFNSPYKSVNIIDFWRRWHMTLSRFLRDYLYIPLGGNRRGVARRYLNLMVTMLLGGLWHGANWTFVVWGGLHGAYLAINHGWHEIRARLGRPYSHDAAPTILGRIAGATLTFAAVVVAWVFFRAASMGSAVTILQSLAGKGAYVAPDPGQLLGFCFVAAGLGIVWFLPNTQAMRAKAQRCVTTNYPLIAFALGAVLALCLLKIYKAKQIFIYWSF